jgi:ATP-dependent DNA helicase DinG
VAEKETDDYASRAEALLNQVIAKSLPNGERREAQHEMCRLISQAISTKRHLVIEAGTGTGKSYAYLCALAASGKRCVVATVTRGLQDRLARSELPALNQVLRPGTTDATSPDPDDAAWSWAVLKGRDNYLCLEKAKEYERSRVQPQLGFFEGEDVEDQKSAIEAVLQWPLSHPGWDGDKASLEADPGRAWEYLSTSAQECPGKRRCPSGRECYSEAARERAQEATLAVVNLQLYGTDIAAEHKLLGDREIVVIDEAHQAEEILSAALAPSISPGRLRRVASLASTLVPSLQGAAASLQQAARQLEEVLSRVVPGQQIEAALEDPLEQVGYGLAKLQLEAGRFLEDLFDPPGFANSDEPKEADPKGQRVARLKALVDSMLESLQRLQANNEDSALIVEAAGNDRAASKAVRRYPLDLSGMLRENVWPGKVVIATTATVLAGLGERLGLGTQGEVRLASPFDYEHNSRLYCPRHIRRPGPRGDEARLGQITEEIAALATAAGGRTLALFTSYEAMRFASGELARLLDFPVLTQTQGGNQDALLRSFVSDESACLCATMGFWQGIDVPGGSLVVVTMDRIPFPHPRNPLIMARQRYAFSKGKVPFQEVDLPWAATRLAQGAGRLIRTASDKGVVAILDPRLLTAKYASQLMKAMPPMPLVTERAEVIDFLSRVVSEYENPHTSE